MDPTDIFNQLKPILDPALDFLEQVAGKTADRAAARFGAATQGSVEFTGSSLS